MRSALSRVILALLAFASGPDAPAQVRSDAARGVVIVSSDGAAPYVQAAQALTGYLVGAGVPRSDLHQLGVSELAASGGQEAALRPRVYVALGAAACTELARQRLQAPVLCALLPGSSFERALGAGERKVSSQFTALFLDQPLGRQLAMLRLALPQVRRVGVLVGAESAQMLTVLRSMSAARSLRLVEGRVDQGNGLAASLSQVLDGSDALLALPDAQVFNSDSIRNILLSTFRARVPVLAFSPAYVRAGALLGLYVTPTQVGVQAAALVLDALHDKPLPPAPVASNDFEVSVNDNVASALNLSLDAQGIRLELLRGERAP